jgi:hypothetical protein
VGQHRRDEARQYRIRQAAAAEPAVPGHAERVAADVTAQAMRTLLAEALAGLSAGDRDVLLSGLATLQLLGNHGFAQVFFAALTWLTGLPAVWLLWRPASSSFFKSAKAARSLPHRRDRLPDMPP